MSEFKMGELIAGFFLSSIVIIIVLAFIIYILLEKKFQHVNKISDTSNRLDGTVSTIQTLSNSLFNQIDSIRSIGENLREGFQKFYDTLLMKPSAKGTLGEGIVRTILTNFPEELWKEQYPLPGGMGRVDFAIFMPPDNLILPLDSKFSISEELLPEKNVEEGELLFLSKEERKKINQRVLNRIPEVARYINPSAGTMNFALMFIPDYIYLSLNNETIKSLQTSKVIPVNTSGLLSTLFLIERQHASVKISKVVDQLEDIKNTVENNFNAIIQLLKKAEKQNTDSLNNIRKTIASIDKAKDEIFVQFGLLED